TQANVEVLTTEQSHFNVSQVSVEVLTVAPLVISLRTLAIKLGVKKSLRAVCEATNTRSLRAAWTVAYKD
ncbi:hypothetical protein HWQ46_26930, partial [Shewanella sp. D64]